MPVKTVTVEDKTYAELNEDGNPVYTLEDGSEQGYNGEELAASLSQTKQEAARHRTALKDAHDKLKPFEGVEDIEAYKTEADKAIEKVKSFDAKDLVEAGKVEEIKQAAVSVIEERHAEWKKVEHDPLVTKVTDLEGRLHKEMIGGRFARSKFIEEKVAVPAPMVQAYFGTHFTIEEDKVVAKTEAGNPVYSKANPGEPAEFEEALQIIIESSPYKENILKGTGKNGTGAPGSGNNGLPGEKTMLRSEADKLAVSNPAEMSKRMADGWVVVDPT